MTYPYVGVSIDFIHQKIHDGELFQKSLIDTSVNNATPKKYRLKTGPKDCHTRILIQADGAGMAQLFAGSTFSGGGTERTLYNKNRNSIKTPGAKLYEDPTSTTDGTAIDSQRFGSNKGNVKLGGEIYNSDEWVLEHGTEHIIVFTPDGNGISMIMTIDLYETVEGRETG